MPTLPAVIVTLLLPFEHLFDPRISKASAKRTTGAVDDRPARVAHFTAAVHTLVHYLMIRAPFDDRHPLWARRTPK